MCRQPVGAVGESPVMLSPLANMFVSLSSVREGPLGGVAQVIFHGVPVVEIGLQEDGGRTG